MTKQIMQMVTQPYHGSRGELLYEPGQRFPLDHPGLPEDLRLYLADVIVDVDDEPEPGTPPAAASGAAPGQADGDDSGKAAGGDPDGPSTPGEPGHAASPGDDPPATGSGAGSAPASRSRTRGGASKDAKA